MNGSVTIRTRVVCEGGPAHKPTRVAAGGPRRTRRGRRGCARPEQRSPRAPGPYTPTHRTSHGRPAACCGRTTRRRPFEVIVTAQQSQDRHDRVVLLDVDVEADPGKWSRTSCSEWTRSASPMRAFLTSEKVRSRIRPTRSVTRCRVSSWNTTGTPSDVARISVSMYR